MSTFGRSGQKLDLDCVQQKIPKNAIGEKPAKVDQTKPAPLDYDHLSTEDCRVSSCWQRQPEYAEIFDLNGPYVDSTDLEIPEISETFQT